MGVFAGPEIAESGLVLALDAGNSKGFDDDENLLTYSEQFDDASWGKGNGTISTNLITAPDETLTADAFIENTTLNAYHFFNKSITKSASSITYTFSIFVKSKGGRRVGLRIESGGAGVISEFNVVAGTITVAAATYNSGFSSVSSTIVNYPNDWYRITLTATSNTSTSLLVQLYLVSNVTNSSVYTGDGVSGIHILGGQLETSSSASPYYPTTASAKNRGSTLIDMTGRGNTGTLTNGPTYSSANGGSLVFDGVNDRVDVLNPGISQTFTVSAWVNCSNVASSNNIVSKNGPYFMRIVNSKVRFNVLTSVGSWLFQNGTTTLSNNIWYNFSMTYDSSFFKGYINSNLEFNTAKTGSISINNGLYIGYTPAAGEQAGFNGNIAQVSIYNRALTAAEIQQNFNATRSRFSI